MSAPVYFIFINFVREPKGLGSIPALLGCEVWHGAGVWPILWGACEAFKRGGGGERYWRSGPIARMRYEKYAEWPDARAPSPDLLLEKRVLTQRDMRAIVREGRSAC